MVGKSTRSVHEESPEDQKGSVVPPIYETSTFSFPKAEEVPKAVHGESPRYVYTRWDNPTLARLEAKMAAFEGAEAAAFFSSGMAAISTSVLSFVKEGDHVVATRDLYGEAHKLMAEVLPRFGVETSLVDTVDLREMESAVRRSTKVVYIESPANPTLRLVDIRRAAKIAHLRGALLLIDGTFASPINQQPLRLGADVVLHSATKYINGHADVVAGAASGSEEKIAAIKMMRRTLGGSLDPHAAWLVMRGMKTMALRVRAQNENAMALAEYLSKHKKVRKVNYPGLKSHPQHSLAMKQMSGFGGVLSFEIEGDARAAARVVNRLRLASIAASLGGVETLVSLPFVLSHHQVSDEEKRRSGIPESLIRVAVGVEDADDLIQDFGRALSST
ncbi:MAG TPA: aminotransferase class I/II-fold pyridoxal phosphate-dependent enzyme [Nitrososphaerales archaeon]|nr:aminotransferase class I/II-fold pyridoxal phosphate-dependent enzyme [Nitrososphaerales archaeon]